MSVVVCSISYLCNVNFTGHRHHRFYVYEWKWCADSLKRLTSSWHYTRVASESSCARPQKPQSETSRFIPCHSGFCPVVQLWRHLLTVGLVATLFVLHELLISWSSGNSCELREVKLRNWHKTTSTFHKNINDNIYIYIYIFNESSCLYFLKDKNSLCKIYHKVTCAIVSKAA